MKFAVFGATGQTGVQLVKQALDAGHSVAALVRNPAKMSEQHDNLTVSEVDIFDNKSFLDKLDGCDAVFSCLGFPPKSADNTGVTGYTNATKSIVEAMKAKEMKRLVICHSWYTEEQSRSQAMFLIRWFLIPMIRPVLDNMREVEVWLEKECKDIIDYTIVRPAGLQNKPVTDREIKVTVGECFVQGAASQIARADVARFMLDCQAKEEYNGKMLSIGV